MKKWAKTQRIVLLLLLSFLLVTAAGIAALLTDSGQGYTPLDKAFYLTADQAQWIRPGLNVTINDITIPADNKPVVTFTLTDGAGQPLDRTGVMTPGTVSTSWIFAYIPKGASQYVSYYTRSQTSPITGVTANQAGTGAGTYVDKGNGTYTFTFTNAIPSNYDQSVTHTIGTYATRNLRTWGLSLYVSNVTKNFVPNGSQVTTIRDVAGLAACNQCHDPLAAHGETGRRDIKVCVLCHTPQTVDPDTGNTVDMKVMTHKIHMGEQLPSVKAGKPYIIIGNAQSINDFSTVAFPRDERSCKTCHQQATQANNWYLNPTRDTCGSCHDDINWASGANHTGGPAPNDTHCADCHYPQGDYEWDASIIGAHTVPDQSSQLAKPKAEIVSISNTGPGQSPTVQFKLYDKTGANIPPKNMGRLTLRLGGPTSDYTWNISETATSATATSVVGVNSYTFKGTLPASATGTYSVGVEGRITTNLQALKHGQVVPFTYNDALTNVEKYYAVTGTTVTPRRTIVDPAKCNNCHERLQLHGNNRNMPEMCVICHNPTLTVTNTAGPNDSANLKWMVHKIHTGEELTRPYMIGSTSFNEVRYPGDRRDCTQCHTGTTYTLPLTGAAGQIPTSIPNNYWTPVLPVASACLGCHDSVDAAAHALLNTASIGESCTVCHKESAEFAVSLVHAR